MNEEAECVEREEEELCELKNEECLHGVVGDTMGRGYTHCVRDFRGPVEW